jgi:thioesterase domain-containing protein
VSDTPQLSKPLSKHLLLLQPEGKQHPLFIVPGSGGMSDVYADLASQFKDHCPVYGLQMHGLFPKQKPLTTIRKIAARNLQWIREVQPHGPYRFMGHSFGAYIVAEMSKQLEKEGEIVELVILLDAAARSKNLVVGDYNKVSLALHFTAQVFEAHALIKEKYLDWIDELKEKLQEVSLADMVKAIGHFLKEKTGDSSPHMHFLLRLLELQMANALIKYEPAGEIRSPLLLFRASEENWEQYDETLHWNQFAQSIEVVTIPGDHLSITRNEGASLLAAHVKQRLRL